MHDSLYEQTPPKVSPPSTMSTTSHRSRRTHRTHYSMPQPHPAPTPSPAPSNIAENLHMPSHESYNFDPTEPYIAVAGQESVTAAQSPPPPGGYRPPGGGWGDFVGGFRKVLGVGKRKSDTTPMRVPSTRISMPRPLVAPRDVERDAQQQSYPQPSPQQYSQPAPPPPTSTVHGANNSVEGTTAVDHGPMQPVHVHVHHSHAPSQPPSHAIRSPVLVEPQPGSDYAKMYDMATNSSPPTEMSFSSYLSRLGQFFRDLNNLPWVAERITVDYVPGQPTQRLGRRMSGSTRPSQQVMSWYGGPHGSVNLLSDGSASIRHRQMPQSPYVYGSPPPPIHLMSQQPQMGMAYPGSAASMNQPPQAFMMHPQYYVPYQPDGGIYAPQPQMPSSQTSGHYPYPVSHHPQQSV